MFMIFITFKTGHHRPSFKLEFVFLSQRISNVMLETRIQTPVKAKFLYLLSLPQLNDKMYSLSL